MSKRWIVCFAQALTIECRDQGLRITFITPVESSRVVYGFGGERVAP